MYLIDTNIFLEILLARSRKESCKNFLKALQKGEKTGIVTDFTIHSIIVVMSNLKKLHELKTFLLSLTAYEGLHIYHTTLSDEVNATEIATTQNLDMDDAIQYAAALSAKADAIISFDKHFNNLRIPREEP
ncbi:MAG: PIN domain-containing protein [Candidatus Bathyarchaeia archaeon]